MDKGYTPGQKSKDSLVSEPLIKSVFVFVLFYCSLLLSLQTLIIHPFLFVSFLRNDDLRLPKHPVLNTTTKRANGTRAG